MENATKALIIAGGVLISIIIASLLMLMFNNLANFQKTQNEQKAESEMVAFNQPFEGYHRNGVRGNDLISLINRVNDYNSRKIEDGYEPITLVISIEDPNTHQKANFSRGDQNQLFTDKEYTLNNTQSIPSLDQIKNYITAQSISANGNTYHYTEQALDEFVTAYDKIFISDGDFASKNINQKIQIFYNFNNIFGKQVFVIENNITEQDLKTLWNNYLDENNSKIREVVNDYYEYVQFKRAIFNCTEVKYNEYTGRIEKMKFEYTGVIS